MSTLVIDTIQCKTTAGSVNVRGEGSNNTYLQQGLAKHFVNFNGDTSFGVRGGFNNASVTDHGTGDFSTFYTNNMSSAENRCILTDIFNTKNEGGGENSGEHRAGGNSCQAGDTAQSTTRVNFHTYYGSSGSGDGAKEDHDGSYCATFGDLS